MKEIRCPQCGCAIAIDDADYAAIVSQIRGEEFEKELSRRSLEAEEKHRAETARQLAEMKATTTADIDRKDLEIDRLKRESQPPTNEFVGLSQANAPVKQAQADQPQ